MHLSRDLDIGDGDLYLLRIGDLLLPSFLMTLGKVFFIVTLLKLVLG